MADRYQDRPYPAHDDYGRGDDQHAGSRSESDPLAELARLIGQTDPFAIGRANVKPQPRAEQRPQVQQYQAEVEDAPAAGPPPWLQRAHRQDVATPAPDLDEDAEAEYQPSPVHPLHRYAAQQAAAEPQHQDEPQYSDQPYQDQESDQSRYDDALYGQIEAGLDYQRDPAYPDDPYAYQNAYDEEPEEPSRKRGGLVTVAVVLALAVLGTGGAFAYRNFMGSPRSGEPPIIKADNSPTKIMPAGADSAPKTPDRMALGDGSEKLVPREEAPMDVNARSGPRVVFPPLNQNANPPSVASVAPSAPASTAANGTLPSNEPRKIKTLSVKGDAADSGLPANGAPPPTKPAARASAPPAAAPRAPSSANASANGPLSLTPGTSAAAEPPARVAAVNPAPAVPVAAGSGGYVVQVSSQKNEADAQASYRALQSKFPTVLGSRAPLIKRADLGDKGVYYRAMVGPFGSQDEATQFCGNLKTAGGQCVVQRN
ncbi:MAG TPA: SPOR domain-containing protein [Bradyrhizobium sp.]|nr:SPOR domain-containing protein [Bradyrhizobium sp.]